MEIFLTRTKFERDTERAGNWVVYMFKIGY